MIHKNKSIREIRKEAGQECGPGGPGTQFQVEFVVDSAASEWLLCLQCEPEDPGQWEAEVMGPGEQGLGTQTFRKNPENLETALDATVEG